MRNNDRTKGFTLLEVVIALAVFSIITLGTIQVLAQGTKSYRNTKTVQSNLERAQFVLNAMAKELRTSSVVQSSIGGTVSTITFFDYSQGRCIQYRADESAGTVAKRSHAFSSSDPDTDRTSCLGYIFTETYETVVSGLTDQMFSVDVSTPPPTPHVGRVTAVFVIGTSGAATAVQTTVSLRDYNYNGI